MIEAKSSGLECWILVEKVQTTKIELDPWNPQFFSFTVIIIVIETSIPFHFGIHIPTQELSFEGISAPLKSPRIQIQSHSNWREVLMAIIWQWLLQHDYVTGSCKTCNLNLALVWHRFWFFFGKIYVVGSLWYLALCWFFFLKDDFIKKTKVAVWVDAVDHQ